MPVESALPIARSFAHFLNLANVAEQHHRVRRRRAYQRDPRARPQPASIEEALPRLLSSGDRARRPAPRRLQPRHRARRHRASDRDHAAIAPAQVSSHRRRAGGARPQRRHVPRARNARRNHAPRDHRGLGDRRSQARAAVAARRGALGARRLRRNAVGRAAALLPLARSDAASVHGPRSAARRRAHPLWLVDRRRPRRQPVRHTGRHAQRLPDGALDRAVALREGDRAAAIRAVDVGRDRGAAGTGRRRARALPRHAAIAAAAASTRRAGTSRSCCARHPSAASPTRSAGYAGFTWEPEMFEPVSELIEPLLLCHRSLLRHRQRHHRRRPADRRPPAHGGVRRDAGAARRTPGSRASHRGRRCHHARAGTRRVRVLGGGAARRFPRHRADARPQADAAADADERARRRSPRHVPHDGSGPSRVARRVRDHDGREAVGRPGRRAPAARGRRDTRRVASSRCSKRRATCGRPPA